MKGTVLALVACLGAMPVFAAEVHVRQVSYAGDDGGAVPAAGEFRNPVVAGFHPDPSMVRVGEDFYLVNSSFGYFPGLPVFHSRDMVSWKQIGNAIDRPSQMKYGRDALTRGLFAATISHHDGVFYIANTCFYCDGGNYVVTARNPAGPWSDPVWLGFGGIDPSLFFDEDGRAWMVNNDIPQGKMRYDGHRAVYLQEFDIAAQKMFGPRTVLVDAGADPASNPEHVEGPHLFKRDGWYYLTAAEGGTGEMHAQMVWRSRAVTGPFVPWQGNPSLTQRDLDPARPSPVTSAGHAQYVELADGSWWSIFLATRPYRGNQYNLGRETFLLPVTWVDGWPRVLEQGQAIPLVLPRPALPAQAHAVPTSGPMRWSERFHAAALPPQWLMMDPPASAWFKTGKDGLRLQASTMPIGAHGQEDDGKTAGAKVAGAKADGGQPSWLAHRLQHHAATLELEVAVPPPGVLAGLAVVQSETHHFVLGVEGGEVVLYRRAGKDDPVDGVRLVSAPLGKIKADAPVALRMQLDGPVAQAAWRVGTGAWQPLGPAQDASLLSTDTAGGFIGATFGPYALQR